MSAALISQLVWLIIVVVVLLFQSLAIWWLRMRVRDLEEYEYWYFRLYQQPQTIQQPRKTLQHR
jgi:hypothetical protein